MVNVRYYDVALWESHRILFREESLRLNKIILDCLQKLEETPTDLDCIEKMVNTADIVIGDARFLEDKNLESNAKMLVQSFKGVKDIKERPNEFNLAKKRFRVLINKNDNVTLGSKTGTLLTT